MGWLKEGSSAGQGWEDVSQPDDGGPYEDLEEKTERDQSVCQSVPMDEMVSGGTTESCGGH